MKIKKIFNLFLIVFCLFMLASCNDKENQNQGYDGRVFDISLSQNESVTATIHKEGTNFELVISGQGEAINYQRKELVPWNAISKKINKVTINEGINNIGNYYFYSIPLEEFYIPKSVLSIEENSFNNYARIYSYSTNEITINCSNNIYYYSEETPDVGGKYWHKIGDSAVIWDAYKIMFVGNSFTFYPNSDFSVENPGVCALTKSLADDLGLLIEVDFVVKGAHSLSKFANEKDEMGSILDSKLKASDDYDYIILQEHSTTPATNYQAFSSGVEALVSKINKTQKNCEIVLYATWGFPDAISANGTFTSVSVMEGLIREAYLNCASENGLKVNHVGKAFTYVYENYPNISLYGSDDKHQSYEGAYLSACVHLATLFNVDVREATYYGKLAKETADILQEVAFNIANDR